MALSSALQLRDFRVADGDAREMRNAADGRLIDGHDDSFGSRCFESGPL